MAISKSTTKSRMVERLLEAMIHAERGVASELVDRAFAEGLEPSDLIHHVLAPALISLGKHWEMGTGSLSQTYVGAKIAEDVLHRCLEREIVPERSDKGAVVIGNIEDDFHSLGRRIVGIFLRAAGWDVHDLGNDVPAEDFVDKALEVNASVVGVSAMTLTTAMNIRKVRDLIDERGLADRMKLAVGGAVFNWRPELVAEVGGDGSASNAAGADAVFTDLQSKVMEGAKT